MSIDHVSAVLNLDSDVTGTDRMVLLVLAEAAHSSDGECWPSLTTIRRRAGLAQDRYARKAIVALEGKGLIEVEENGCPDTRIRVDRRPNLYRMAGVLADSTQGSGAGGRDAPRGGATRSDGGARRADATVIGKPEGEPEGKPRPDARAEAAARFDEHFWPTYPSRNGRKLDKRKALDQWVRLSIDDQRAAVKGARALAASGEVPRDAHRWLRDHAWEDWLAPVEPGGPTVGRGPDRAVEAGRRLFDKYANEEGTG